MLTITMINDCACCYVPALHVRIVVAAAQWKPRAWGIDLVDHSRFQPYTGAPIISSSCPHAPGSAPVSSLVLPSFCDMRARRLSIDACASDRTLLNDFDFTEDSLPREARPSSLKLVLGAAATILVVVVSIELFLIQRRLLAVQL